MFPKTLQDTARRVQNDSKRVQNGPERTQSGAKRVQNEAKKPNMGAKREPQIDQNAVKGRYPEKGRFFRGSRPSLLGPFFDNFSVKNALQYRSRN